MHLIAKIVPYVRPPEEEFSWSPGPIDMRRYWMPETSRDPAADESVELYAPGHAVPLYRSAPYPGSAEEQVRAAVKHFIVSGVYSERIGADTLAALRECALAQRSGGPQFTSNLDSMLEVAGGGCEYAITLRPPVPQAVPQYLQRAV